MTLWFIYGCFYKLGVLGVGVLVNESPTTLARCLAPFFFLKLPPIGLHPAPKKRPSPASGSLQSIYESIKHQSIRDMQISGRTKPQSRDLKHPRVGTIPEVRIHIEISFSVYTYIVSTLYTNRYVYIHIYIYV